jgi:phage anti-repressor protein
VETIFQQPPSLGRRESVSKPVLKKDRSDENRNATLKDLTQTKFKLERALEYGFIQRNEYEQSGGVIQEIEASLPDKTDFTEDRKNLLTIQTMLDEKESSTVEARRLDVQQELEELSQTRLKLERALKYGFIQKNEHESLTDDINAIEASLPGKTDFTQDRKMLLTIRNMLDEKELSTVEARRLAMRKEFQQIKNSFLTNKPATSSNN